MMPIWSSEGDSGQTPSVAIWPRVGLKPMSPVQAAGMRTLPPVSVPSATSASPAATAAALPPDDPPTVHPGAAGFDLGGGDAEASGVGAGHADNACPPLAQSSHRRCIGRGDTIGE